jgi:hypothetical protein
MCEKEILGVESGTPPASGRALKIVPHARNLACESDMALLRFFLPKGKI